MRYFLKGGYPIIFASNVFHNSRFDSDVYTKSAAVAEFVYVAAKVNLVVKVYSNHGLFG